MEEKPFTSSLIINLYPEACSAVEKAWGGHTVQLIRGYFIQRRRNRYSPPRCLLHAVEGMRRAKGDEGVRGEPAWFSDINWPADPSSVFRNIQYVIKGETFTYTVRSSIYLIYSHPHNLFLLFYISLSTLLLILFHLTYSTPEPIVLSQKVTITHGFRIGYTRLANILQTTPKPVVSLFQNVNFDSVVSKIHDFCRTKLWRRISAISGFNPWIYFFSSRLSLYLCNFTCPLLSGISIAATQFLFP